MAENIPMLALSPTMEKGVIVKWMKEEGDAVAQGDVLCEVETDKATMEYESPVDGTLLKIITAEGQSATIGDAIAVIGEQDEQVETLQKPQEQYAYVPEEIPQAPVPESELPETSTLPSAATKLRSSPLARKLAELYGLDINAVKGTGPNGRIVEEDVKQAAKHVPAATAPVSELAEEVIEITPKRKLIAKTLANSKFTSPHYYLKVNVITDNLIEGRKKLNAESDHKISINAFLIKFVAELLQRHPVINSTWQDDRILQHGTADIALAVSQPDGLIAPVVRQCQFKSITQIDSELKALVEKTRAGSLTSADYANSTFTITNLGSLGIDEFTAIINPPNSAILAVGKISKQFVVDEDERMQIRRCMTLTLSCDHRLIDGAVGAAFLTELKDTIESSS
ncbi:MAG TPA: 2-oxo acid dehydrogenase subunit E2 [Phycisphaerales bacterium]|nr:2-oxo acid dehydrogenase subunit E2 [Phycisphaerales bacterium]